MIRQLGSGSFGSVELIDMNNKIYTLKIIKDIDKKDISQYKDEANILSNFNSRYIIRYYNSYIKNNNYYILMEYAGDSNLKNFIRSYKDKGKLIDGKIIENIIIQICLGLKEIHNQKIIHGDLKPENIFINKNNEIKIVNFGISKKMVYKKYESTKIGTQNYMAPEIINNEKYNNKVDIYSLGCIIYELFTLNQYFIDKIIDGKEGKIDLDIYSEKWQNLIDLSVKKDYNERPDIDSVYNYIINKTERNEILLTIKIEKEDIGQKVNFLNDKCQFEINESNSKVYINNKLNKSLKYFIPEKEALYQIKLILFFPVKDCSNMFGYCRHLESINLSMFDTKNVTNMESMFNTCDNLKDLDLSSFDTKNVTNMSNMFWNCEKLENIDLSSFDTKNVTDMHGLFYHHLILKMLLI